MKADDGEDENDCEGEDDDGVAVFVAGEDVGARIGGVTGAARHL